MIKSRNWGQKNKLNSKGKQDYFSPLTFFDFDHFIYLFFRKQDLISEVIFFLK